MLVDVHLAFPTHPLALSSTATVNILIVSNVKFADTNAEPKRKHTKQSISSATPWFLTVCVRKSVARTTQPQQKTGESYQASTRYDTWYMQSNKDPLTHESGPFGRIIHLDHFFDEPSFFVEDVHPWRSHFPVDQQRHPHLRHRLKISPSTETANFRQGFRSANCAAACA